MALDLSKIQAINQKAATVLKQPVSSVAPMQTPKPTPAPSVSGVTGPQKPSVMQNIVTPIKNVAQKVLTAVNKPSQWVEDKISGVYGQKNYEDVFKQNKMPSPLIGPSALGARMLLDPLNLVPLAKPGKILGKLADVSGVTKLASKVKGFVNPMLNLPEELQYGMKMIPRNVGAKAESYVEKMAPIVKGLTTEERTAAAHLLEPKVAAQQGINLGDVVKNLGKEGMDRLKPFLHEARQQAKGQIYSSVQNGAMTGDVAKGMLRSGGYFHHTDFAPTQNVLQRIFKQGVQMSNSYWKERKGKLGYSLDAPLSVAERHVKQLFDEEKLKFLNNLRNNAEYAVKVGRKEAPEGFVKVAGNDLLGRSPVLKGYALKKNVYDAVINLDKATEIPILRQFNNIWKPIVTGYNPAFHAQNLLGNLFQMGLSGVKNPKRYLQAIAGNFTDAEKALAKEGKILNSGQVAESLNENIADVSKLGKGGILRSIKDSKLNPLNWLGGMGNKIENNARSALYLDKYEKALRSGATAEKAAQDAFMGTNKYLFDYMTGLGPKEKAARSVLPFYSWMRFNAPLQAEGLLTKPAFYGLPGKISKTVEPNKGGVPDERGFSFPTPWKGEDGGNVRYTPNLPMNTLFDMAQPGATLMNMVSPMKNLPVIAANLTGNPAQEYGFGGPTGSPIITPGLPLSEKLHDAKDFLLRQIRPFRDIQSSAKLPFPASILKYIFGGLQNVNEKQNRINDIYRAESNKNLRETRARKLLRSGELKRAGSLLRSQQ